MDTRVSHIMMVQRSNNTLQKNVFKEINSNWDDSKIALACSSDRKYSSLPPIWFVTSCISISVDWLKLYIFGLVCEREPRGSPLHPTALSRCPSLFPSLESTQGLSENASPGCLLHPSTLSQNRLVGKMKVFFSRNGKHVSGWAPYARQWCPVERNSCKLVGQVAFRGGGKARKWVTNNRANDLWKR